MTEQQLMIEDYYGFSGYRPSVQSFPRERSSQRTERSPRPDSRKMRSPPNRALKRTELSKEKLSSKDSKKQKLPPLPELNRFQGNKQEPVSKPNYQVSSEQLVGNRQDLEMMVKKYDNYMRADSVEFTNREVSHTNNGSNFINEFRFRPDSIEGQYNQRINYHQRQPSHQQYTRYYHSASRGRNTQFISNFQRPQPVGNAIDRANQNISERSNNSRYKKSKSLTNTIKKKYIMHTFYHAQRKNYYNYNDDGYLTGRQEELLIRIEEKARRAFDRALFQNESSKRDEAPAKKQTRTRKFEVQDSSRMQHLNSDLLDDLKLNEMSRHNSIPVATKRSSNRSNHQQRVVDVSINPLKEQNHYDDYQMKQSSHNIQEIMNKYSNSKYLDEKQSHLKQQNQAIQQKLRYQSENDDSLLEFRPRKKNVSEHKSQKKVSLQPSKGPSQAAEKEQAKRASELSDYRSVDMMEINSNCRFNQKDQKDNEVKTSKEMKQSEEMKQSKQSRQKMEVNSDDNRSLGINTIKSFDPYKRKNNESSQRSSLSESQSSSHTSSHSGTISEGSSIESSHMKASHKLSRSGSNKEKSSMSEGDFSKNKLKVSHSASELISDCIKIQISKPPDSPEKPVSMMKKKEKSNVNVSESEVKKSSQINGSSVKKIKRLKKAGDSVSQSIDSNPKIDNVPKIQSLSALGMQSFRQFDKIEPLQIKVAPLESKDMSPIEQDTEKVHSISNSKFNEVESPIKSKNRHSINNSLYNSQHSVSIRSKMRSQRHIGSNQNIEYDLFTEVREFIQDQQFNYHQIRKEKQDPGLISPELDDILNKIEEHLYLLNCIAELILIVPDLYDFETIYNKKYEWIFLSIFLTLKKYVYERQRVVAALSGGKNCFNILGFIIENDLLNKYKQRIEVTNIRDNLIECNGKLDSILQNFHKFLVNFKELGPNDTSFQLKPFSNSQQLFILLSEYDKQIDNLKQKREQEFNGGHLEEGDDDEYETLMIVNERIFRLMEIGFVMGNLAGRASKAYQKDEQLYKDQEYLKDYIVENEQMFKQMIKYFK